MTQTRAAGQKARVQGPPRRTRSASITLTGRGGAVALFAACFCGLLIAAWTGWDLLADAMFVTTCGLVACYTRVSGLRGLVVCPPLAFLGGSVLVQLITAADTFSAATGILITLGTSAPWLFTGTGLTVAIALGRGWRPELPAIGMLGNLRDALRGTWPRGDRRIQRRLAAGRQAARSGSAGVPEDGADHRGGVADIGRAGDGQRPG